MGSRGSSQATVPAVLGHMQTESQGLDMPFPNWKMYQFSVSHRSCFLWSTLNSSLFQCIVLSLRSGGIKPSVFLQKLRVCQEVPQIFVVIEQRDGRGYFEIWVQELGHMACDAVFLFPETASLYLNWSL